jgi:hypothetical protein
MRFGILALLFSIAGVALLFNEFAGLSAIKQKGVQGTFTVTEVIHTSSKRGSISCSAKGYLDGQQRWFLFEQRVFPRRGYTVVYDPSSPNVVCFREFYVGTKNESIWDLLNRKMGSDYLWAGIVLFTLMGVSGVWSIVKALTELHRKANMRMPASANNAGRLSGDKVAR